MKRIAKLLALVILLGTTASACSPHMARTLVGVAIVGAAIAHTAHVIHHYDMDYHNRYCYQTRRWYDGRWVYRCRGRTVYYQDGYWYEYR